MPQNLWSNVMNKKQEQILCKAALEFCRQESGCWRKELFAVTDGKAIGTLVEHNFEAFLLEHYHIESGSSANGLDLPSLKTDIKVTSIVQPQSSCPYRSSRQKVYGLGYNLIVFVYRKEDDTATRMGALHFVSCSFVHANRTADYQLTKGINDILSHEGTIDDIYAFLNDKQVPGDEITLNRLAEEIMKRPPKQGYLTISNALQWRLQYSRVVTIQNSVSGIKTIIPYAG